MFWFNCMVSKVYSYDYEETIEDTVILEPFLESIEICIKNTLFPCIQKLKAILVQGRLNR